jgi:hypothetical protein
MHLPDGSLAPLFGAKVLFRILPRPVSADVARRGQKRMAFRSLSPWDTLAEMGAGSVEGIGSIC